MQSRFSIFKSARGEATKNGYVETSVGCNGDLHATWVLEVYLADPNDPDSEHVDAEDISQGVTGPCDHTCGGAELGWFNCETRPKLVLIN